jgi:hypothetical protein
VDIEPHAGLQAGSQAERDPDGKSHYAAPLHNRALAGTKAMRNRPPPIKIKAA